MEEENYMTMEEIEEKISSLTDKEQIILLCLLRSIGRKKGFCQSLPEEHEKQS